MNTKEKVNIKRKPLLIFIVIFSIFGILLILLGNNTFTKKDNKDSADKRLEEYETYIEEKITSMCSKINGVGNVYALVYFDTGFESVYAYDEDNKQSDSSANIEKKYVKIGSGSNESMVTLVEKNPTISGIAIVCDGGWNPIIVSEITNLLSSTFGLSKNKIYVTESK